MHITWVGHVVETLPIQIKPTFIAHLLSALWAELALQSGIHKTSAIGWGLLCAMNFPSLYNILVTLFVQTKELTKSYAQGHTTGRWQNRGSNPGLSDSKAPSLPTTGSGMVGLWARYSDNRVKTSSFPKLLGQVTVLPAVYENCHRPTILTHTW